jgi:hypothetical protein
MSAVRFPSQNITGPQPRCTSLFCRSVYLTILSAAGVPECSRPAAVLQLHASRLEFKINSWQQRDIFFRPS